MEIQAVTTTGFFAGVKYFHRTPQVTEHPYTCAFYEMNGILHYAVARCHSNDNFDKKMGRAVAYSRLYCKKHHVRMRGKVRLSDLTPHNDKINMHSIIDFMDKEIHKL